MDIYTVVFFGHRNFNQYFLYEKKLNEIIRNLILEKENVEFIVGRNGEFDKFAASVVKTVKKEVGRDNCFLTCFLPYSSAEYRNNKTNYEEYYDSIEICEKAEISHFKKSIEIRNKEMAERADFIICYINKNEGGAYKAMKYAEKKGKRILNLFTI